MHTHQFRIAYNLPMSLPDIDGWTRMLLVRACRECDYAEAFHGTQHLGLGRNRLQAWEVWVAGRMVSSGEGFKWKRM